MLNRTLQKTGPDSYSVHYGAGQSFNTCSLHLKAHLSCSDAIIYPEQHLFYTDLCMF